MKRRLKVAAPKRRERELRLLPDLSDEEFLTYARRLASAATRPSHNQLLQEGLEDEFASRLLGLALRASEYQVTSWKLVGQFWAHEVLRQQFRKAKAEGPLPSLHNFSGVPLTWIVHAMLALYRRDALAWCICAYLIRTGRPATEIEHAIVGGAFSKNAIIEAIGDAFKELEAELDVYPRGMPTKLARLLSQSLAARSTTSKGRSAAAKSGAITLTPAHLTALIKALHPAKLPAGPPTTDGLENALAETAWTEADEALARALQQTPALREAIREPTQLAPQIRSQLGAIIQAVRASAAKRELEFEGDPGTEADFDPVKHARDDPRVKLSGRVRIVRPTVFQGRGANRRVLRVADVEPV